MTKGWKMDSFGRTYREELTQKFPHLPDYRVDKWYRMLLSIEELYFRAQAVQKNGKLGGIVITVNLSRPRAKPKLNHRYSVEGNRLQTRSTNDQYTWTWKAIEVDQLPPSVLAVYAEYVADNTP